MITARYTLMFLIVLVYFTSCKNSPKSESKFIDTSQINDGVESKKTQALLLTQPLEYDPSAKNKVTDKYIPQSKITVPQNLATQNKWIMFEGPVLENDLVAYRYYADSRHRFDIYGKTTSNLVMDTVSWKYHDIMDWGSDILKVGNSLGLGSPAIWFQDSLYTLSNCEEKTIEIIETNNNTSIIRTIFKNLDIEGKQFNLKQDWSINAGRPWSEIHLEVINGELPEGMYFATGFVNHLPEIIQGEANEYLYTMNWGKQSFHKENMGMAILANKKYQPVYIPHKLNHAYVFKNQINEVYYRFLSVWERDNNKIIDEIGFKKAVERSAMKI